MLALSSHSPVEFSPNDDRRKDVARIWFELAKPAKVKVKLTRGERASERVVLGPVRLGRLQPGKHVWKWDGRKNSGRTAGDGRYEMLVKARLANGRVLRTGLDVKVDTVYDSPLVAVTDSTVYPTTDVVHDLIRISYDRGSGQIWHDWIHRGIGEIINASGDVVDQWAVHDAGGPLPWDLQHGWDGRDAAGNPLPAGAYWIQYTGTDKAGNRGSSPRLPVQVTHTPLVEVSGTASVSAAESGRRSSWQFPCGAVDLSSRYQNGITIRTIPEAECPAANQPRDAACSCASSSHAIQPDVVAPRGIRTHRVTMRGAPAVDGESDVATLNLFGGAETLTPQAPGEAITVSPTYLHPFRAVSYPRGEQSLMGWMVQTVGGNSYDVAEFTVDYTYLTPQT